MVRRARWIGLSAVLTVAALWAADRPAALIDVKVAEMQRVDEAQYAEANARASRGGDPIEIALAVAGPFEGATQQVIQVNEGADAPKASRVTVLRDGLLDDSMRGERWDVVLARTDAGTWRITEVRRAWRCWRGAKSRQFATDLCL